MLGGFGGWAVFSKGDPSPRRCGRGETRLGMEEGFLTRMWLVVDTSRRCGGGASAGSAGVNLVLIHVEGFGSGFGATGEQSCYKGGGQDEDGDLLHMGFGL